MKKLLLSMQLLFLSVLMLQAQTIVTIGNGTTGVNYLPVGTYHKYSFSEQIILANEYTAAGGVAGYISSIGFQYIYGTEQTKDPVSIYIGTTSDTVFSTTQFIPITNMTLVYEGPITFNNSGANYWATIPFNETYFYYGGTENLVIAVKNNTGEYTTGSSNTFYTHVAGTDKSLRYLSDSSPWTPQTNGNTKANNRNNMRFEIVPQQMNCPSPIQLSIDNITSNSGDLTWTPRGSETSWEIEYRVAGSSEWTSGGTLTNSFYTFSDLISATDYQVRIRAVCGSEEFSPWKIFSFTTLCETISIFPFHANIDNANGNGAAYFPYCWLRKTSNSIQYPYVSKDQYYSYPYSLYFFSNKTDYSIGATPALGPDVIVEDLSVIFKAMKSSTSDGVLEVGLMSDPTDENTFTVVQTFNTGNYTASKTWYEFEVSLNCDTCIGRHIAFRAPKMSSTFSGSNYVFIDDITIASNCSRPGHVELSNITGTTADVTFDGGTNSSFQYMCLPFTVSPYMASEDGLYDCSTSFTIDNLLPNTKYDLYIRSECPSGYSAWSKACTFSTECTPIAEFPYTNNFENQGSYIMNNKSYPTCWTRITNDASTSTYYPYIHTLNSSSTPTALYFSSNNSNYYGMALPPLDASAPAHTVQLRFKALVTSATYGYLQIGVMTNPADINTFTLVKELSPSDFPNTNMWYNITVPFHNYQGEGLYIAIISPKEKGYLYLYMDDVVLEVLPTCIVTNPSDAYEITSNSATVNWEPNGSATQVEIKYGHYGFMMDTVTAVSTTDTFYNFLNLEPNTPYSYYVRTVCGGEETEWSTRKDFRTECSLVETFPYFEGFEGEPNSDFIFCWKRLNPGNTSVSYPKTSTYKKRTGAYSIQFNSISNKSSVAISPELAENIDIANLQISFYANTNTLPGVLEIGVMSDPDDISTFTVVNTIGANNYSATSTWCYMESYFIGYEGDARYIAIRAPQSATNNDIYVDDITVDLLPACPRIFPIIRDISSNQITVKIPNNGSAQSFDVVVADTITSHPDTCSSLVNVSEDSVAVTGLQPNTRYYLYVRGNCGNETSGEWSFPLSFYTSCSGLEIIDFPWKENFDVNWTTGYYNTVSLWSIKERVDGTFRDNCMSRIGASYVDPGGSPSYTPTYYTYPAIYATSSSLTGPNVLYLCNSSSIGYQPTYITTPRISENVDIHTLKFTCQVRRDYLPYGNFDIGVMENPADSSTYTVVRSFSPSSFTSTKTYEKFSVPMETYEGTGRYITVRMRGDGSTYETMYMDNFMIEVEDACAAPLGVKADTVKEYSATLSWEPRLNHESYEVLITTEAVNPDTVIATFYTSSTNLIEIEGLEDGNRYYAYVRAYCQNESNPSRWTEQPYIFFTKCLPVPIPLVENFDIWGTGTPARPLPPCWSRINDNTSNPNPYIDDTYPYSGPGCIYLYTTSTSASYLVSPELDVDDWSNLKVRFKARINSNTSTYGKLTVGISTDPSDTTTYTVLHTINHANYTVTGTSTAAWIDFEFPLTGYTGEGHYLVIGSPTISNLVYIDNFALEVLPDCQRPYNVVFSSIDVSSAVVSWDNNNAGNYQVVYGPKGFNIANGTPLDVNAGDTSYLITGLNSNTFYDVYVRSHCGEAYGDWSFTRTFRTGCTAITALPFTENFDNEPIGSGVDVEAIPCWNRHYPGSTSTIYPYVNSNTTAPSAPNVLYFSTSSTYYSYVTLPVIDVTALDLSDLQLSFKLRKTSANYKLEVGVMTDPHNFATYQVINSNLSPAATNTWEDFTVNFSTYTGNGAYITLLAPAGSTIYLDDILLENRTFCDAPTNFTTSNIALTSATLSWTENEGATAWQVAYGPQGFVVDENAAVMVNTNPYTLSGLQPHTIYDCYVRSVCSVEGYSSWVKTTFYTIDNIPNTSDVHFETFEDYVTGNPVALEAQTLGRTFWNTWNFTPGNATDALVSNEQASTGNKSLKVLSGNDNVLLLTDTNMGIHTIEWDIFVPTGKKAYHSVMQEFINGDQVTRGVEIYFSEGTVGHIKTAGNIQVEFNYTPNTWVHNAMIIDLDQDVAVFMTGGRTVHTWQWSNAGIKKLRGMNIFGENQASTLYYIDNIDYVSSLDSTRILLASADENGTISPVGTQIVPVGSTQSFTMTPNTNCVINDVVVDGNSVLNQLTGNVYTFTNVRANHSVHATFRDTSTVIVEYTITASAGIGGTITPSGDVVVTAGTSKTFTMTAESGYEIQQVLVDGNSEGLLHSYTFNNILANHVIHVDFNNVGIEDLSMENQVQLSPNPADNFIYVSVSDQLTVKEAGIYDVYGKLVKDLSIKNKNTEINVSALSSGIYFVRLACDEGFITKKFVKK